MRMSVTEGSRPDQDRIDWERIEHSPEFQELVVRKRRFVLPATIFFLGWYIAFILLAGYAEDFMGSSIIEGFTVGYLLALTQFVMVWVLTWLYLRKARDEFDPLEDAAVEHLREQAHLEASEREAAAVAPDGSPAPEEVRR
jgi:uncharacterized membrane protein (DUF485 family)